MQEWDEITRWASSANYGGLGLSVMTTTTLQKSTTDQPFCSVQNAIQVIVISQARTGATQFRVTQMGCWHGARTVIRSCHGGVGSGVRGASRVRAGLGSGVEAPGQRQWQYHMYLTPKGHPCSQPHWAFNFNSNRFGSKNHHKVCTIAAVKGMLSMKLEARAETHCMRIMATGSRADSFTDSIILDTSTVISSISPSFANAWNRRSN